MPSPVRQRARALLAVAARQLRGELGWVVAGQVAVLAGGFATLKLLAVVLGPSEYGRFALGLSVAGIGTMFLQGPLSQAALRYWSVAAGRGELGSYFGVFDRIYLRLTMLQVAVGLGVGGAALLIAPGWAGWVLASVVFGAVAGLQGYPLATLSAARRRREVAVLQGVDALARPAAGALSGVFFGALAAAALGGISLAVAATTALGWRMRRRTGELGDRAAGAQAAGQGADAEVPLPAVRPATGTAELRREAFAYARSIAAFSAFAAVSMYADRWILAAVETAAEVGVYAVMAQLATVPLAAFTTLVSQWIGPVLYQHAERGAGTPLDRGRRLHRTVVAGAAAAMGGAVLLGALFARPLLELVATPAFATRHALLWPIMLAAAVFQVGQLLTLEGMMAARPGIYFWPKAVQAVVLVATGVPLATRLGLAGLAGALVLSSLAYLAAVIAANTALRRSLRAESSPP